MPRRDRPDSDGQGERVPDRDREDDPSGGASRDSGSFFGTGSCVLRRPHDRSRACGRCAPGSSIRAPLRRFALRRRMAPPNDRARAALRARARSSRRLPHRRAPCCGEVPRARGADRAGDRGRPREGDLTSDRAEELFYIALLRDETETHLDDPAPPGEDPFYERRVQQNPSDASRHSFERYRSSSRRGRPFR